MALPKIELPLFEAKLFSTGKTVKFRPFTVKEEKILLIAQEANDIDQTILAIRQIITNCVYDIDIETLPMFDMEYLLLQLRAKSINNVITFNITDPETQKPVEIELDIDTIGLTVDANHSKEISVSDDMRLIMRYPRLDEVALFKNYRGNEVNTLFDIMISCIDCVVDGDSVSRMEDFSKEETKAFIETFPGKVIQDLKTFFETIPVLRYEVKYVNANGNEKKMILEGMETFFI